MCKIVSKLEKLIEDKKNMVDVECQTDYVYILDSNPISEEKIKVVVPEYIRNAGKRYIERNREKINQKSKERYKEKYHNDPVFREKEIEKAKEKNKKRREKLQKEKLEKSIS